MHHLTFGVKFHTHFVSNVLICLFLIYISSMIISLYQCHYHHSCDRLFFLSNFKTSSQIYSL